MRRFKYRSPQLLPGRENPPAPWHDRKEAGMTVGELLTEEVEDIITPE